MILEDQVATKDQCEKLNDLFDGSEDIKTAFYWRYPTNKWVIHPGGYFNPHDEEVEWFPAYTVAELGRMLPEWLMVKGREYRLYQWHNVPDRPANIGFLNKEEYRIAYRKALGDPFGELGENICQYTEAQVRAAMLIHILEKKYVTIEEIIARLVK